MKKLLVVCAVIMLLNVVARGGNYTIVDDWLGNTFVVNTDAGFTYGNQFVLPATLTDSAGNRLPDKALALFDANRGNVNLIIFGFSCTLGFNWDLNPAGALLGYIGNNPLAGDIWFRDDSIYLRTPSYARLNSPSESSRPDRNRSGATNSEEGHAVEVTGVSSAVVPGVSTPKTLHLQTGFGDHYYLDTLYDVYPSIYVYSMTVENANGTTDGLLFFQRISAAGNNYFVIITVFAGASLNAYSMVGVFNPDDADSRLHYFVVLAPNGGFSTTLY